MKRNTLIPYLSADYIKIVQNWQNKKINSMGKNELLNNLKNPESWIYDYYLREECINLFIRTGYFITSNGLTYDDLYKLGVDVTITQINKRYFFDLKNDNNSIIKKVKSRIINNLRNYFSPTRRINYLQFQNLINQIENSHEDFEDIIFEIDLTKINRETMKMAFKKVYQDSIGDMDFDIQDFQELCAKYGFTPLDVLIYDPYMLPSMSKQACNNSNYQLVLVFEEKIV